MRSSRSSRKPPVPGHGRFTTTHWSLVAAARNRASLEAEEALASLCRIYWSPLYAYIRRLGHGADEAQDLTQEFFTRFLDRGFLASVDREKGRFRSFLLAACKHFLANEHDRARALKRGAGREILPLDFQAAEDGYRGEPFHELTPERLFERRWALVLLDQVLAGLRENYRRAGKGTLFERLKAFLTGEDPLSYRAAAAELGTTEGAIKVAVHRLRQRYKELLKTEIAKTLRDPQAVEGEIRHLLAALGPGRGEGL